MDARWTIQTGKARRDGDRTLLDIAIPSFGYKAHTSIDRRYRLIRCWEVTDASRHDGHWLRQGLLDPTNTGAGVWADTAYRSQRNETFLERHGFISHIHRRRAPGRPLPAHIRRGNATRSRDRALVEHVFAVQKQAMGLMIRTIGLASGAHQDRDGQPRLQPPAPGPTSGLRYRLTSQPRDPYARTS